MPKLRHAITHLNRLFLRLRGLNRVSEGLMDISLAVDTADKHPGSLLCKTSNLALMLLERAQVLLALPDAFWIVVPWVRPIADTFPVVATRDLIRLSQILTMVELLANINHAQS